MASQQLNEVRSEVGLLRTQIGTGQLAQARTTAGQLESHARNAHDLTTGPVWAVAAGQPGVAWLLGETRASGQPQGVGRQAGGGVVADRDGDRDIGLPTTSGALPSYFGAPYTHGTPFRRAAEEGLLAMDHASHVGTRGPLYSRNDLAEDRRLGFATVSTDDVARRGVDEAIDRIRECVGDHPIYLSVDIDVLDPAHAPGTGTPEPGGLTTRELQIILRGLTDLNVVGADVVEVAPAYDHAELTALAAANVVYEYLGLFARQPR